jgi:uncharacterized cofD-like protein
LSIPAWLAPGSTIKRWLLVCAVGLLIIILGIDYLLVDLYRNYSFPAWSVPWIKVLTLQYIPRPARGVLFLLTGVTAIVLSLRHLNRVIVGVIPRLNGTNASARTTVITAVAQRRLLMRGPRIVAIGGGTGMSKLLHGLRNYSRNITVVVTVADDGGSSGRLRRELRILPPGDFRQCIAALANVEDLMVKLLNYRFEKGSGLEGHSFGNLFIAAMADITGSFEEAVAASSRVLAVQGQIVPSTLHDVTLAAELRDQSMIEGESVLAKGKAPIERVFLLPEAPEANQDAVDAIRDADIVIIGPGSLYTSVMPNLLVPGIARAVEESRAPLKVFICNVATEPGETDGYSASDFVNAIERHVGCRLFDFVVTNSNYRALKPDGWKSQVVRPGAKGSLGDHMHLIEADVVDNGNALRHDPEKLAQLVQRLYESRRRASDRPNGRRSGGLSREDVAAVAPVDDTPLVAGRF